MKIEVLKIGPFQASELLLKNTCNRSPKPHKIMLFTRDMMEGRWMDNTGESIKISKSGILIDGQNRLMAIVKSGCTIEFLVISQLDHDIIEVIDSGTPRTTGDTFGMKGITNASKAAAVIKTCITDYFDQGGKKVTTRMILNEYKNDPVFWDNVVSKSKNWNKQFTPLKVTIFGYCFYKILKQSKAAFKACSFFDGLASGECSEIIRTLRNKLINNANRLSETELKTKAKVDLIRKYWNGYVSDKGASRKIEGWR